jgi:hypothetical protein
MSERVRRQCSRILHVVLVMLTLGAGGCSSCGPDPTLIQVIGQTIYNTGKYACRQNPATCDVPEGDRGPAVSSNRR